MKSYSMFLKYLTIRLFDIISRKLAGKSYTSTEMQLVYSTAPADWDENTEKNFLVMNIAINWMNH